MLKYLAEEISLRLVTNKIITDDKRKYYTYGLELILSDIFIFLILALVAIITNTVLMSVVFACTFCILRSYSGGYHSKTYAGCFIITLSIYSLLLIFNTILDELRASVGVGLIILSLPIIFKLSPIENINHPIMWRDSRKFKKISTTLAIVYVLIFITSLIYISDEAAFSISWSLFATAFLMMVSILLNKKEE